MEIRCLSQSTMDSPGIDSSYSPSQVRQEKIQYKTNMRPTMLAGGQESDSLRIGTAFRGSIFPRVAGLRENQVGQS